VAAKAKPAELAAKAKPAEVAAKAKPAEVAAKAKPTAANSEPRGDQDSWAQAAPSTSVAAPLSDKDKRTAASSKAKPRDRRAAEKEDDPPFLNYTNGNDPFANFHQKAQLAMDEPSLSPQKLVLPQSKAQVKAPEKALVTISDFEEQLVAMLRAQFGGVSEVPLGQLLSYHQQYTKSKDPIRLQRIAGCAGLGLRTLVAQLASLELAPWVGGPNKGELVVRLNGLLAAKAEDATAPAGKAEARNEVRKSSGLHMNQREFEPIVAIACSVQSGQRPAAEEPKHLSKRCVPCVSFNRTLAGTVRLTDLSWQLGETRSKGRANSRREAREKGSDNRKRLGCTCFTQRSRRFGGWPKANGSEWRTQVRCGFLAQGKKRGMLVDGTWRLVDAGVRDLACDACG
jgi:hypothetical protein